MVEFPVAVHAYPNADPHAKPLAKPESRPQTSSSGSSGSGNNEGDVYRWVDPQDNVPGDNIAFGPSGPLGPYTTEDEQHTNDAIISLDGILHYMPTTGGVTHTRRFAVMPVTVLSARVLRGPKGFGCFLGSMPGYIRRAEEAGDKGMEGFANLWRTSPRLSRPEIPADSDFLSGGGTEDDADIQDQQRRNPIVSPAFFSTNTPYGIATTREPFYDAVFLTCFTIPSSPSPPLASESNPYFDPETDIVATWLEFAPPEPNSDLSALTTLSDIASSFSTTSLIEQTRPQDIQQYGFGAFVLVRIERLSSLNDEAPRLGRWHLSQSGSGVPLPMTLESAAVVYGPRSSGGRTPESQFETDAECIAFRITEDERGEGFGVQEDGAPEVSLVAEGITERARFGMRQQFMGAADGSGADGVEGLLCFEGRASAQQWQT